jgi:hypothetical protein
VYCRGQKEGKELALSTQRSTEKGRERDRKKGKIVMSEEVGAEICSVYQGLVRYLLRFARHRRKEYEYRGGTDGAGFYAIESG